MAFVVYVTTGSHPARGVKVSLGFTSTFQGRSDSRYTDVSDRATFEGRKEGPAEILLNGISYGLHDYRDGGSVTLSLDTEDDEPPDE